MTDLNRDGEENGFIVKFTKISQHEKKESVREAKVLRAVWKIKRERGGEGGGGGRVGS